MKKIKTKILKINSEKPDKIIIKEVIQSLKKGLVAIFPTDTIYGIGAPILNKKGVLKIYSLKKRSQNKPLLILIANKKDLKQYVKKIPLIAEKLIKKFWPGPLTLIFEKTDKIPDYIVGGGQNIAIRLPENKFLISLIKKLEQPLIATSANLTGKKSPISAQETFKDFLDRVEIIVDGDKTKYKKESTIIDLTQDPPIFIREGAMKTKLKQFISFLLSKNKNY